MRDEDKAELREIAKACLRQAGATSFDSGRANAPLTCQEAARLAYQFGMAIVEVGIHLGEIICATISRGADPAAR